VPISATYVGSFPKHGKPNTKYTAKIKVFIEELNVLHPQKFHIYGVIKVSIKISILLLTVHYSAIFGKPFRNHFQRLKTAPVTRVQPSIFI
jgi:hypothetical protein